MICKHNKLVYFFKMVLAFFLALFFVNSLCRFYYSPPQFKTNLEGFSTYKYKEGICFKCIEGIGKTTIDSFGFNNDGSVTPEDAKVVCIGSSQTLAAGMNTAENYVSLLNQINNSFKAYNVGVGNQFLSRSFFRIPFLVGKFPGAKTYVVETPHLPEQNEWTQIADNICFGIADINYIEWDDKNPVIKVLRSMPYARLLFYNYSSIIKGHQKKNFLSDVVLNESLYEAEANRAFAELNKRLNGQRIVILYLTDFEVQPNDELYSKRNKKINILKRVCRIHNAEFINMGPYFKEKYDKERVLPNGFKNYHAGKGHLNKNGHKMVAEVLSDALRSM